MAERETWQQREARERREAEERMSVARQVLRRLGVTTVIATYDGAGDSGWVQEVRCEPAPAAGLPEGLTEVVRNYVEEQLPGGWEINEGSSGTVTIDVRTGKTTVDHHWKEGEEEEWEGEEIDEVGV